MTHWFRQARRLAEYVSTIMVAGTLGPAACVPAAGGKAQGAPKGSAIPVARQTVATPLNLPAWRGGGHPAWYDPTVLRQTAREAADLVAAGKRPVAVFDLDHTLIDNRPRTLAILRDLVADRPSDDRVAATVRRLTTTDVGYDLDETLRRAGVNDPSERERLNAGWLKRFFTNDYVRFDVAVAGAAEFVNDLARAGVLVVYLSGRDADSMEAGTRANLVSLGFPLAADNAWLLLKRIKPGQPALDDRAFKRSVAAEVASRGRVFLAAENEPLNLTGMACDWPGATLLFLDTDHDPKNDAKLPPGDAHWLADFRYSGSAGQSFHSWSRSFAAGHQGLPEALEPSTSKAVR